MDNRELYKHRFDELMMLFKRNRREVEIGREEKKSNLLIDISGDAFRIYSGIVERNEGWVIYMIECMARNLLYAYDVEYDIPEYEEVNSLGKIRKIHPFAFSKMENDKKIGYIFRYSLKIGLEKTKFNDIDGIKVFFIKAEQEKILIC